MTDQIADVNSNFNKIQHHIADLRIISLKKFIILCIASFGLYQIWWMFKAWRFFQTKEQIKIMPAARAIFSLFFFYSLFERIRQYAKKTRYSKDFSPLGMFVGYLVATMITRSPDPYWFIALFSFIFYIPAFQALNFAKKHTKNLTTIDQENFNTSQIIVIIIGVIVWSFLLLGFALLAR
jgi:hypothetical protein